MKNIEFKDMPETYEEGNIIFFKEPYLVDAVLWGSSHRGCRSVILNNSDYDKEMLVYVVAFPKSKEFNSELYSIVKNSNKKYSILTQYVDCGLYTLED